MTAETAQAAPAIRPRRLREEAAASYLGGLSPWTLEKWRRTGRGPLFLKVGRTVLYDVEDLDRFLEESKRRSTSDDGRQAA
jgi:hypothetical protein